MQARLFSKQQFLVSATPSLCVWQVTGQQAIALLWAHALYTFNAYQVKL